jgi:hypothetical protein
MSPPPVLTTHHAPELAWWSERTRMLDRRALSTVELVRRLVAEAPADGALILEGSVGLHQWYADLVASAILARRRHRPVIVLSEVGWEPGSRKLGRFIPSRRRNASGEGLPLERGARWAIRTLDSPQTNYCVLARAERDIFPRTWGVDPGRVWFTPFFHMMPEDGPDSRDGADRPDGADDLDGSIFAGGNSLRDYGSLVSAAPAVSAQIRIASTTFTGPVLSDNVVAAPVPEAEFYPMMRRASVVVVPLAGGQVRCAGLLSYLNAMALGKLVVVTDSLGVRDYVEDRVTGLVVREGDPRALAEALRWALDPANRREVDAIAARARQHVRTHFTVDQYLRNLLAVAEQAMAGGHAR